MQPPCNSTRGLAKTGKRKVVVAFIALFVFACGIIIYFLYPVPVFGYSNKLYDMAPQPLKLIEGGDLFDVSYCGIAADCPFFRVVPKRDDADYTLTAAEWTDDKMTGGHLINGTVSKRINGKWSEPEELAAIGAFSMVRGQDFCLWRNDSGGCTFLLRFPLYEYSGRLRFTLYFRECVRSETSGAVTSVGELLSATFEMDMPKPSRSMFDVVSFDFVFFERGNLCIRKNTDEDISLWLDNDSFLLEKEEEAGRYREVMHGYHDPYDDYSSTPEDRYTLLSDGRDSTTYSCVFRLIEKPEPGDYRLTLKFYTNEDGSGDCYTLTLKLRFHEQGSALRE